MNSLSLRLVSHSSHRMLFLSTSDTTDDFYYKIKIAEHPLVNFSERTLIDIHCKTTQQETGSNQISKVNFNNYTRFVTILPDLSHATFICGNP